MAFVVINTAHVHKVVMHDTPVAPAPGHASINAHVAKATENATQISAINAESPNQLGLKVQSQILIVTTATFNAVRGKRYWWERALWKVLGMGYIWCKFVSHGDIWLALTNT